MISASQLISNAELARLLLQRTNDPLLLKDILYAIAPPANEYPNCSFEDGGFPVTGRFSIIQVDIFEAAVHEFHTVALNANLGDI